MKTKTMTLEQVEARILRLQRKDRFADSFPLGCGRGGRQRRSSKSVNRSIDASVLRASELVRLYARRNALKAPVKPSRQVPTREQKIAFAVRWFDSLKAGDIYQPGNYPLPIVKRTANAIWTEGCRWSIQELAGISPSDANAFRDRQITESLASRATL